MPANSMPDPQAHVGDRRLAEELFNRALDAHDANNLEEAYNLYLQAVAADPSMEVTHNNIGMVLIDMGNYREAVSYLKKAVELKPDYPEPFNNLGFAYRRMGDEKSAARSYQRFLELSPDVADADRIRLWIESVLGEDHVAPAPAAPEADVVAVGRGTPAAAAAELPDTESWLLDEQSKAAQPAVKPPQPPAVTPESLLERAEAAYNSEDYQTALSLYSEMLASEPGDTQALIGRGGALLKLDRLDEAAATLAEVVKVSPREPSAHYLLGFALRRQGNDEAAADAYERFLALAPDSEEVPRIRQWIDEVRSAAKLPADEKHYNNALTLFQEGNLDKALVQCEETLYMNEHHGPANVLLGRILLRKGDYIRAVAALKKAAEARPADPEVHFYLGQAFERRGLNEEAREAYEKCLEVSPSGPRAERVRKWLEAARRAGETALGLRCEYCLRTYPAEELFDYQDKKACRDCLSHLGIDADGLRAAPASEAVEEDLPAVTWETFEEEIEEEKKPRRHVLKFAIGALLLVLLLLAAGGSLALGLVYAGVIPRETMEDGGIYPLLRDFGFDDYLARIGIDISAPEVAPGPGSGPTRRPGTEPGVRTLAFVSRPPVRVGLLEALTYEPKTEIQGKGALTFSLVERPAGASIDAASGRILWNPMDDEGVQSVPHRAEFVLKAQAGGRTESQKFTVEVQFPYGRRFGFKASIPPALKLTGAAAGDLNNDGMSDLVLTMGSFSEGRADVYYRNTAASFSGAKRLNVPAGCRDPVAADLDGDGDCDLAVLVPAARTVALFAQDEQHALKRERSLPAGVFPISMARLAGGGLCVLASDNGGCLLRPAAGEASQPAPVPFPVSVFSGLAALDTLYAYNLSGAPLARYDGNTWHKVPLEAGAPLRPHVSGGMLVLESGFLVMDRLTGEPAVEKTAAGAVAVAAASEADVTARLLFLYRGEAGHGAQEGLEVRVTRQARSVLVARMSAPAAPEAILTTGPGETTLVFPEGSVWVFGK